jgi:integrase/recombinase XerC/integrase/recombinase XerD
MRVLDPSEASQLLAAVDLRDPFGARDFSLVQLALHTGLRVSELIGLNHTDVLQGGMARIVLFVHREIAKGRVERKVPLNETARRAAVTLLGFNQARGFSIAAQAPLFVTRKHERVSVRLVQRLVQLLRKRAGLAVPATPHALRRTFATQLVQASGHLLAAKQILGHRRLETIEHYVRVSGADLAAAVEQIAAAFD